MNQPDLGTRTSEIPAKKKYSMTWVLWVVSIASGLVGFYYLGSYLLMNAWAKSPSSVAGEVALLWETAPQEWLTRAVILLVICGVSTLVLVLLRLAPKSDPEPAVQPQLLGLPMGLWAGLVAFLLVFGWMFWNLITMVRQAV